MKYPVLRVRKGAEYYDDSRSEEISAPPADADREPRRRGRRRGPIFLPLVVVVIALAAVFQLVTARDTARFRGWDVRLRASPYNDVLLVAVTFTSRAGVSFSVPSAASVRVQLPDTGAAVELSGTLTPPTTILRGELPLTVAARKVTAEITIGEEHRTLSRGVAAKR